MSRTTDAMIAYKECVKQWPRGKGFVSILRGHEKHGFLLNGREPWPDDTGWTDEQAREYEEDGGHHVVE